MLGKGIRKALCCYIDVSCTCLLNTECILAFSYKSIGGRKKKFKDYQRHRKICFQQRDEMEEGSSTSGRKKRLEQCHGVGERGQLFTAFWDTGIKLDDIKSTETRKEV